MGDAATDGEWAEASARGARSTRGKELAKGFAMPTPNALVVGSIIGTGVFALPFALALALYGSSSLVAFVLVTIVLVTIVLVTIVLFFIKPQNFGSFNPGSLSLGGANSAAAAIALFSYPELEVSSVAAGRVRSPHRNASRATGIGMLGCGLVYILGTLTVYWTVSRQALSGSTAPFSSSTDATFGGGWAGKLMAVFAIISIPLVRAQSAPKAGLRP
jgi:APA family basic amino acid/polyamine antiporter